MNINYLLIFQNETIFKDTVLYDLLIALLIGVISGVIASLVFFLILRIFKPKISISPQITRAIRKNDEGEDEYVYKFKFINNTRSDIENVSIDLFLMEDYFNGSAKNYKSKNLEVAQPEFKFLTGKGSKNDEIHNNCVQMTIKEPLEELWNGHREWLHLQIDSKHSKSGRRKVEVKTYKDPTTTIVDGRFDSGDNFNILN
nr:hypothetical protein [Nonlabens ulvanivorans]